jgi:CCR4-NOT transcriptional regulation complex NOT5 subunit
MPQAPKEQPKLIPKQIPVVIDAPSSPIAPQVAPGGAGTSLNLTADVSTLGPPPSMERKYKKADIVHQNGVDLRHYEEDARNCSVLDLLETSYKNCPMVWDQEVYNAKNHVPRKIEETYDFPTVAKYNRNENFARFDPDTLFFVFYFQHGTY